ncbi:hypothetical protein DYBT9275_04829 [Dyadobacter sp. CECT 9275]|uniref:DUF4198 domain-containing protein n=1 Tax=Dyadobacter helix TaxID=2822344 RepID=A0A916NDZ3_9BACT|nr:DUF4198 domain-containing protein [Dyadobacter sp. CECT 9275]CAG5010852.1 hypothetical protein DYBT9275_04829 [Dyadobacter sp. CECT 9275]
MTFLSKDKPWSIVHGQATELLILNDLLIANYKRIHNEAHKAVWTYHLQCQFKLRALDQINSAKISLKLRGKVIYMKIIRTLPLIASLLVCSIAFAHEFWLEPVKFWLKINEKVRIDLMVGEDYQGQHTNGHKYKISKLDHYSNGEKQDIRTKVYGDSLSSIEISFQQEGSQLVAFNNTNKFIQLEASKFNEYLRTEGLDNVAKLRQDKNDTLQPGRELYQRCVKTLVQVGNKLDGSYAVNTGMKLEIIPKKKPYAQKSKAPITFKILFDNKPLNNALVLAWHMVDGKTTHEKLRSDKAGLVSFPIDQTGKWMISTVHMIASGKNKEADWQSYWGSYTFGFY